MRIMFRSVVAVEIVQRRAKLLIHLCAIHPQCCQPRMEGRGGLFNGSSGVRPWHLVEILVRPRNKLCALMGKTEGLVIVKSVEYVFVIKCFGVQRDQSVGR